MKKISYTKLTCIGSLLEAAKKFSIDVEVVDKSCDLMIFSKNGRNIFVKRHILNLNSHVSSIITSNKALIKRILKKNNISTPEGIEETSIKRALQLLDRGIIKFPLVVKPVNGDQGRAVTADIRDKKWFVAAINEVFKYNRNRKGKANSFFIEDFIPGDDFRFLVLDNKVLTVLMRKPAYVIGDGVKTIGELIDEYNSQPGVRKDQPLCPIVNDYEFERNLLLQKLSEKSVIPKRKVIYLRKNANVSTGGRSFECFYKAHEKYIKLAVKLAKLFNLRFCSVDVIAKDISKYEKFGVIEINNNSGFDIHEVPYRGKPYPVAEHLVKAMFN